MIPSLCNFTFLHRKCRDDIKNLNAEIVCLLGQIQELKAINDYQTFELEQKIKKMEEERREQ